jgi:hypothetical protein
MTTKNNTKSQRLIKLLRSDLSPTALNVTAGALTGTAVSFGASGVKYIIDNWTSPDAGWVLGVPIMTIGLMISTKALGVMIEAFSDKNKKA